MESIQKRRTEYPDKTTMMVGQVLDWSVQASARPSSRNAGPKGDLFYEHQKLLDTAGVDAILQTADGLGPNDVLLVVDMQNDFLVKDVAPLGGRFGTVEGELAAEVIVQLIALACERGARIVATRDYHPKNHCSFVDQEGPYPSHCVQGSAGSFFFPPIAAALDAARKAGAQVDVVFKGYHSNVDSFGAVPYSTDYFAEKGLGFTNGAQVPWARCGLRCSAIDFTGADSLFMSNFAEDVNAPPDVMAVVDRVRLRDLIEEPQRKRLIGTGLVMDICVLDSCLNGAGLFRDVCMVADATRAVHIPGVGPFGSGFLTDPRTVVDKCKAAGVGLVFAEDLKKPRA